MRDGEFGLALIREIERLKLSRLTPRPSSNPGLSIIREQDLTLVLLRASLGTSVQHDTSLAKLKFILPTGSHRPFFPSLDMNPDVSVASIRSTAGTSSDFSGALLGTRLELTYALSWPLDLLLTPGDLKTYTSIFSYFSAIRHIHHRVMGCWASLSSAQRLRRRLTREEQEDEVAVLGKGTIDLRKGLLRSGWGLVREMAWFFDTLWNYISIDVVEAQYHAMRESMTVSGGRSRDRKSRGRSGSESRELDNSPDIAPNDEEDNNSGNTATKLKLQSESVTFKPPTQPSRRISIVATSASVTSQPAWSIIGSATEPTKSPNVSLDFATVRAIHSGYLYALYSGSLLGNAGCAGTIKEIMGLCDIFAATLERWGGDIIPNSMSLGSFSGDIGEVRILKERMSTVKQAHEVRHDNTLVPHSLINVISPSTSSSKRFTNSLCYLCPHMFPLERMAIPQPPGWQLSSSPNPSDLY